MSRRQPRSRLLVGATAAALCLGLVPGPALAEPVQPLSRAAAVDALAAPTFTAGAQGIGDRYFPRDGNGGYNVASYLLDLGYTPATDILVGKATITGRASQNLSRFNLDFEGLTVSAVTVDGRAAAWSRKGGELTITPSRGLPKGASFRTVVRYRGKPKPVGSDQLGVSGFLATDDGVLVAGQPDAAATWFPVNDHPLDKASYRFRITAPAGLEVVANGKLTGKTTARGLTTWQWQAPPMAPYLTTMHIGRFRTKSYRSDGIHFLDAIDPDLYAKEAPRTGTRYALTGRADSSYKRLSRKIAVPKTGGKVSFWVTRDTEANWDFAFVEAHTVGAADWTTLPDLNGHTSSSTGSVCPLSLTLHPFLKHYQTKQADNSCTAKGSTGTWSAASGMSNGYERWAVDLSRFAGKRVELSISYVSDDINQSRGLFVDDIVVPFGAGSTSFERDGRELDGWAVPGPPAGSAKNLNDWLAGTPADAPDSTGQTAEKALARGPEVLRFLTGLFGPYPYEEAGGIVDDLPLGFALETATRPVYAYSFFSDPDLVVDSVVVHENAHQWTGDDLALTRWRDIWLNEGFATYAEWLWSEKQGRASAQVLFNQVASIPSDTEFWLLSIGNPGPEALFDGAVYNRGAATLHALRLRIGDAAFFRLVKQWTTSQAGGHVTTAEFTALAEKVSGRQLDAFFKEWLVTKAKPAGLPEPADNGTGGGYDRRHFQHGLVSSHPH